MNIATLIVSIADVIASSMRFTFTLFGVIWSFYYLSSLFINSDSAYYLSSEMIAIPFFYVLIFSPYSYHRLRSLHLKNEPPSGGRGCLRMPAIAYHCMPFVVLLLLLSRMF
jgi:hypothetical protein